MHYALTKPCNNCPFLKKGGIPLHPTRVREIAGNKRGEFACHKTTVDVEDGEGNSDREATENSQHCAGALIFHEKTGSTQMMRIAERLGMYDAEAVLKDKVAMASVFDSLSEMLRANSTGRQR